MIEARLRRYGVFQELIHHIQSTFASDFDEGRVLLRFDTGEILLQSFLFNEVGMMRISLDPTKIFKHYHYNNVVEVGVNARAFSQALKQAERHDEDSDVKLLASDDSLLILSERPSDVQKYELSVVHEIATAGPRPPLKCILTVTPFKLGEILTKGVVVGATCSISANEGDVYFRFHSNDDDSETFRKIRSDSKHVSLVVNEPLPEVTFGAQYLYTFLKALANSETATLTVINDQPLEVSHPIMEITGKDGKAEHAGVVQYFLAPKIDEEDPDTPQNFVMPSVFSSSQEVDFEGQLVNGRQFASIIQSLHCGFDTISIDSSGSHPHDGNVQRSKIIRCCHAPLRRIQFVPTQ